MHTEYIARRILKIVLLFWASVSSVRATDYYISPSGNDSHTGTSSVDAWKTVDKVNSATFRPGDRILFEGGNQYNGALKFDAANSGTRAKPIVISSFGNGRAIISSGTDHGFYALNCSGLCVNDLIFVGAGRTVSGDFSGIVFQTDLDTGAKLEYIRIDNVDVSGYRKTGILITADNPSHSGFKDVRITNAELHDNGYAGISSTGFRPPDPSNRPHGAIYIGNCKIYNNAGIPGWKPHSGNGIVLRHVNRAVIEYCEAYNNGRLCDAPGGGPVGIWATEASSVVIQFCESHHNKTSGGDGGGFDLDGGCVNCVMQYNYSHDNEGPGYLICQYGGASEFRNNVCRYNISQNDGIGSNKPKGGIRFASSGSSGGIQDTLVYNNTVYVSSATRGSGIFAGSGTYNTCIYNNIIVTAPGKCVVQVGDTSGGYSFMGNCYWSSGAPLKIVWDDKKYTSLATWRSATDQERTSESDVGFEIDPFLVAPGKGGTISDPNKLDRLTAYQLRADSPLIDMGLDLKTIFGIDHGSRDFFDNIVPQGKSQDIGAHEIILEDNLPLHMAAASGNINKTKELISAGANVNEKDKHNQTPMDLAIRHGHKEVTELLSTSGAELSLHVAAHLGNVSGLLNLIETGANVHQKNKDGQTPLHLAARSGHEKCVKLLVAKGAIVNEEDEKNHFTPLHYASKSGHIDVAMLLLADGSKINARDVHGFTPLHWAALCNQRQLLGLLLSKGAPVNAKDNINRTPLYYAYTCGETYRDIIELLLGNGADVGFKTDDGRTILFSAVCSNQIALVELLMNNGANVNQKDDATSFEGCTPLHYAAMSGYLDMAKLLVAKGADVNAKADSGIRPLHLAALQEEREIAAFLLSNGADVNVKDINGNTPGHVALDRNNRSTLELLIAKGANFTSIHLSAYQGDLDEVRNFIDKGADVNAKNRSGETPLHKAAIRGHKDVIELLIDNAANINATQKWNYTPMHYVVRSRNTEAAEFLIEKGADVNARDIWGWTPLHYMAGDNYRDMAEFLIAKRADVNAKGDEGETPLSVTKEKGHTEIVKLLRKHGAKE